MDKLENPTPHIGRVGTYSQKMTSGRVISDTHIITCSGGSRWKRKPRVPMPFRLGSLPLLCVCAGLCGTRDAKFLAKYQFASRIYQSQHVSGADEVGRYSSNRTSLPSLMGIVTLAPIKADFTWAGRSSGPVVYKCQYCFRQTNNQCRDITCLQHHERYP